MLSDFTVKLSNQISGSFMLGKFSAMSAYCDYLVTKIASAQNDEHSISIFYLLHKLFLKISLVSSNPGHLVEFANLKIFRTIFYF